MTSKHIKRSYFCNCNLNTEILSDRNKLRKVIKYVDIINLIFIGEKPKANPIIDETAGADIFVTLPCSNYIVTVNESADAIDQAEQKLIDLMTSFDYEHFLNLYDKYISPVAETYAWVLMIYPVKYFHLLVRINENVVRVGIKPTFIGKNNKIWRRKTVEK